MHSALRTPHSAPGRILAVDFGTVRVGLAVCDAERRMASPLDTFTRKNLPHDSAFFTRLVKQEQVVRIVVGLPMHMNGDEGIKAKEARTYGAWLAELTTLPVAFWDERCTTAAAEELLWDAGLTHKQRKDRRDKLAAAIILQSYIDAGCPSEPPAKPG